MRAEDDELVDEVKAATSYLAIGMLSVHALREADDVRDVGCGGADVAYVASCGDEHVERSYLASVLDLGSRRLIGYAMSATADTDHVIDAVRMAVATRGPRGDGWHDLSLRPRVDLHVGPVPRDVC